MKYELQLSMFYYAFLGKFTQPDVFNTLFSESLPNQMYLNSNNLATIYIL